MGDSIIGRGERAAVKILRTIFPEAVIDTQVPIRVMMKNEIYDLYDETHQQSSVDIVMHWKNRRHAIRIQDKSHTSKYKSQKDRIQRRDMEDDGVTVIDIYEREAPYLFRNILNYRSYLEVLHPLEAARVRP